LQQGGEIPRDKPNSKVMAKRLNIERQQELEPKRMQYAMDKLNELGITFMQSFDGKALQFIWKGESCWFYPYSGWHSGKSIKDGRGIERLLKQLR